MSGRRQRCVCRKGAGGGGKGGYTRTRRYRGRTRRGRGFFGGTGSQYQKYKSKGWPYPKRKPPRHLPYGRRKVRRGSTKFPLGWRNIRKHSSPKGYTEYYERTRRRRIGKRRGGRASTTRGNPWAICRYMSKKYRWPKRKEESCILKIKRKKGYRRRR